jgi:hypothetical protein
VRLWIGKFAVKNLARSDVEKLKTDVADGKTATKRKPGETRVRFAPAVKGGKGAANRCLALLSKMFNLAEQWGWRAEQTNPVRFVARYKENPRERYLFDAELDKLRDVLNACDADATESRNKAFCPKSPPRGEQVHAEAGAAADLLPDHHYRRRPTCRRFAPELLREVFALGCSRKFAQGSDAIALVGQEIPPKPDRLRTSREQINRRGEHYLRTNSEKTNSNPTTMPKLPPPPRSAQKRSEFSSALARTRSPLAVTMSAAKRQSMQRPCCARSHPIPPESVSPATPVGLPRI